MCAPRFDIFDLEHASEDLALEEEAERRFGWVLKAIFLGTAGLVAFQFFPYMGMKFILLNTFLFLSFFIFYFLPFIWSIMVI